MIQKTLKSGIDAVANLDTEYRALDESRDFFASEFGAEIEVIRAENSTETKARQALPNKPAILVE